MDIYELLEPNELIRNINDGFISVVKHKELPIRIYNYTNRAQQEQYWPESVRVCRGLIVDDEGNVISRPYRKFFNLGQEDSTLDRIESADKVEITRKMDGWLGIFWEYDGHYGVASRGNFHSKGAEFATEKFQKFVKYGSIENIPKGITLLFEIIAKHLKIIKKYDWEGICLTGAIDTETGRELRRDELESVWNTLNEHAKDRPFCRLVEYFDDRSIQGCQQDKDMEEEGYVITGHFNQSVSPIKAKVKLEEYNRRHYLFTRFTDKVIHGQYTHPTRTECPKHSPVDYMRWLTKVSDSYLKEFFDATQLVFEANKYYHEALRATSIVFTNPNEIKTHALRATRAKYGNFTEIAINLENGDYTKMYESIWETFQPKGKGRSFSEESNNREL